MFVTGDHGGEPRKVCGMFAPWMHGSLEYVAKAAGGPAKLAAREVHCQGEGGHDHCLFEVTPE
jgi:hypothetical protein